MPRLRRVLLLNHARFGLVIADSRNLSRLNGTSLNVVLSFAMSKVNNPILDLRLIKLDSVFMRGGCLLGVPLCLPVLFHLHAASELETAHFHVSILVVAGGTRRLSFFEYLLNERVARLFVNLAVIGRGVCPLQELAVPGGRWDRLLTNRENFFQIGYLVVKIFDVAQSSLLVTRC